MQLVSSFEHDRSTEAQTQIEAANINKDKLNNSLPSFQQLDNILFSIGSVVGVTKRSWCVEFEFQHELLRSLELKCRKYESGIHTRSYGINSWTAYLALR